MSQAEMADIALPAGAEVKFELTVTSKVNFTAHVARIRVNKLLLDQVGLFYGEKPSLVVTERLLWRVPVMFSTPNTGPLGQVGSLDVDTQTGEILYTQDLLNSFKDRAHALAERTTPQAD
jgi:hypothetical protein